MVEYYKTKLRALYGMIDNSLAWCQTLSPTMEIERSAKPILDQFLFKSDNKLIMAAKHVDDILFTYHTFPNKTTTMENAFLNQHFKIINHKQDQFPHLGVK